MLITCKHCQRQLNLPDEKVPPRPFALNCPGCRERIEVDPSQDAGPAAPPAPPAPAAPAPEASPAAPAPPLGEAPADLTFDPLPPVRGQDRELLDEIYPVAGVVELGGGATAHLVAGLELLGMRDVEIFPSLLDATSTMGETDLSLLLIVADKATAPPFEPLAELYKVPLEIRRKTFVALMAGNVKSLDGQTAFYLQVNCLLNAREMPRFPAQLQRALLFHRRHYRHWNVQEEDET